MPPRCRGFQFTVSHIMTEMGGWVIWLTSPPLIGGTGKLPTVAPPLQSLNQYSV